MQELQASLIALISMLSLIIGAVLGIYTKPSQKVNAIVMAFGVGALIQALSIELAHEGASRLLNEAHINPMIAWSWVASGFIFGGLLYNYGNKILDNKGGAFRHKATAKNYVVTKKKEHSKRVLKLLSQSETIRALPPEIMEEFITHLHEKTFSVNEVIFNKGDVGDSLYIIEDGIVEIVNPNENKIIASLQKGSLFGEMSLVVGEPRNATAVSKTNCTLLKINKLNFDNMLKKSSELQSAVEKLVSERLILNISKSTSQQEQAEWEKIALTHITSISNYDKRALIEKHAKQAAPLAIFMGALLDGIPESIIIGAGFISFSSFSLTFVVAVFIANLPEAMSSAITMKEAKFTNKKILGLWSFLVIAGAVSAYFGNIFLHDADPVVITFAEAIAGGGILAMISSVMMPEAFEHGGASVGIATIVGFLTAFLFSII